MKRANGSRRREREGEPPGRGEIETRFRAPPSEMHHYLPARVPDFPDLPSPEFLALEAALRDRYVLERELGRGGMGVVFLAREIALDRPVAIKLLPPTLAHSPEVIARFLQEARTIARLAHPHIVPIHAVERLGELVFFVMAYVPGVTLAERVRIEGPIDPASAARLMQEVAWALAHAHQQGVVHRDVKPENILLERGTSRALLTDFGIAQLLEATPPAGRSGRVMGTLRFMSPEQAAGVPVDGRSDLYSLGVTAFYALTGRFPFEASDVPTQSLTLPAAPLASVRPDVPPALAAAVDRCLANSPANRFATAADLADAVAATREGTALPEVLRRISREISSFGVDLTGYATLATVAIVAQLVQGGGLLGMRYVYTFAIALVLLSLTALRGMSVWRLVRDAVREGWEATDLAAAVQRSARLVSATEPTPRPGRIASVAIFLAGLAAIVAFWLGPKEAGQATLEGPIAWIVELAGLIAPVAWGRWLGARLEAPRDGRPGLFSRLVTRLKAGFLFRMARFGARRARPSWPPVPDAPTEVLLANAARDALHALPDQDRSRFSNDIERLLSRLERDAAVQRRRLAELDGVAAKLGGGGQGERERLAHELKAARAETSARLETAVRAMETLRIELLRHIAELVPTDGLTDDLEKLKEIADRAQAEAELDTPAED
jgi:hypothetical protein